MEIGGIERSLVNLLSCIDYDRYEVDLFLFRHAGELIRELPKGVNLLPENKRYSALAFPALEAIKRGQLLVLLGRSLGKFLAFLHKIIVNPHKESIVSLEYSHKYTKFFLPKINNKMYDLAISFVIPHYFVPEKISAKMKVAWIHTDYSAFYFDKKSEFKMWNKFDKVIAISEACSAAFLKVYPSFMDKMVLIENILSQEYIRQQASMFSVEGEIPSKCDWVKLCSVGRFAKAKNFDNIPDICRRLLNMGVKVKWYLIGFGSGELLIKKKIAENNVKDNVIILGKKYNPYPYMKACDIYVQPSRYEGKCVCIREAQILNKPVVITDFSTSRSQVKNGFDAVIVPMDNVSCALGIKNIIEDKEKQRSLVQNTQDSDYENKSEILKLYSLIP